MRDFARTSILHDLKWSLAGILIASVILAALGPFGTFDRLDAPGRFVYWTATVGLIWIPCELSVRGLRAWLGPKRATQSGWAALVVPVTAALLVSVPATAVVLLVTIAMIPEAAADPLDVSRHLDLYWKVTGLTVVIAIAYERLLPHPPLPASDTPSATDDPDARLPPAAAAVSHASARTEADPDADTKGRATDSADRLFRHRFPEDLGGTLLCLEMEDHYLRLHTTQGSGLILMRMADAERELEHADGMRVHRSFWVARGAIQAHDRSGNRVHLILTNGLRIPVGKTYRNAARDRGYLDGPRNGA